MLAIYKGNATLEKLYKKVKFQYKILNKNRLKGGKK